MSLVNRHVIELVACVLCVPKCQDERCTRVSCCGQSSIAAGRKSLQEALMKE